MHPTVKPVALVADAIRDCSRRGEIVLDLFGGSGTTLIAAETCGRQARLLEYDPAYCDTIITRWEKLTGKHADTRRLRPALRGSGGETPRARSTCHPRYGTLSYVPKRQSKAPRQILGCDDRGCQA